MQAADNSYHFVTFIIFIIIQKKGACKRMKALFLGGTGTISSACTALAQRQGWEITLLNRGNRPAPAGMEQLTADCTDPDAMKAALGDRTFDVVADFIAFRPLDVQRDIELFRDRCSQYIFISSASAYQKPLSDYLITESTPLSNPYWQYSRDKIACEEVLMEAYRSFGFPVTIVRPSHTYCERSIPMGVHGDGGSWQIIRRMREGKPVIVHGDGSSLWTFTFNTDFAKGFCGLMGNPHALGQAVHITSDESLTWDQAYEIVGHALGVKPNLVHISSDFLSACRPDLLGPLLGDKARSVVFDNSKLKRLVPGFHAEIRYDQGVRICLSYIEAHPELQTEDPKFDAWCDRVIAAYFSTLRTLDQN